MTGAVLDRPATQQFELDGGLTLEELLNATLETHAGDRQRRVPRVPRAHDIHARGRRGGRGVRRLRQPPQLARYFRSARSAVANSSSATADFDRPLPV